MLITQRCIIRPFEGADMEDLFEIYRSEEICRFLLHEAWTDENKEKQFKRKLVAKDLQQDKVLSLACELNGKVIGDIAVWYTEMKETVEIGFVFHPDYGGQGYASESVRAVLEYLFKEVRVHRVQANMDARNLASAKLCERLGMRREAHFRQDFWSKGEWTDSFIYGMLVEDFATTNALKKA